MTKTPSLDDPISIQEQNQTGHEGYFPDVTQISNKNVSLVLKQQQNK